VSSSDAPELLADSEHALAVRRTDYAPQRGQAHIETMPQVTAAVGERKYTQANGESVLSMVSRFGTRCLGAVTEAIQRRPADVRIKKRRQSPQMLGVHLPGPAHAAPPVGLKHRADHPVHAGDRVALALVGKRDFPRRKLISRSNSACSVSRVRCCREHATSGARLQRRCAKHDAVRRCCSGKVWRANASSPVGPYRISAATDVQLGDLVAAWPLDAVCNLAGQRGYLPVEVPAIKRVGAAPGDRVCAD
jgi:hypothetical protein